ncbi:MAG: hypothetical protein B7Y20_01190 [Acidovorax sp. 16-64-162]|nr:MAG: hypothetical protein B7Y64_13940 [Acidovorax sp. 35-64-16]OYZ46887.1 MAG: hypothetical protein B7Y20_01190 [Acidovorax sp. 16-64-162]OYZ70618.1 MAG: hypothetical protein B7Y14_03695 [Acidovorax sp. 24-64-9]OZA68953.1 MAG: hypothetical protein B7X70_12765 [Acidovorax sp. 39-64-12]
MSFPRYPEYKDSGVAWLGEVPSHWTICGTGHRLQSPPCYGVLVPDFDPDGVPMLKIMDLANGTPDRSALATISERLSDEFQRTIVRRGDVVLSVVGTIGTALVIPEALDGINLSRALARLLPNVDLLPQWLVWVFSSDNFTRFVDLVCVGSAQRVLNMDDLRSFRAPFPPIEEQTAIATFLDRETAKIDALVAEQEKLIALLQEKRQAVISHAVTKGLDPNVPMKDSGVEWLGEVPAHWEVLPLKRISPQQTVGIVVNPSEYLSDEGLPFIYGGNVTEGRIDHISSRRISPEDSQRNEKTRLKAGDLITVRVGAPGITAVVPPECEGGNCASVMLVRQGEFNSDWLCFVMNSRVVRYQVEIVQYGAAQQQFNINHAVEFVIPQPPRAEQDALASFLTSETTRLGNLEAEARTAIALLQERRTALISAAVTGQIDVRGLAGSANAPDSVAASAYPASA